MDKPVIAATAAEAIDAVGGTNAAARLLGVNKQTVSAWKKNGLPAHRYFELREFFDDQKVRVARSAWAQSAHKAAAE